MARVTSATDEKHRVHKRGARELRLAGSIERSRCCDVEQRGPCPPPEDSMCKGSVARKSTALSGPADLRGDQGSWSSEGEGVEGGGLSWRMSRGHI